jgi:hypothetical protein
VADKPLPFSCLTCFVQLPKQTIHILGAGDHRELPIGGTGPLVLRAIAIQLDAGDGSRTVALTDDLLYGLYAAVFLAA